ncbi:MAG: FkbM family methyltransferase [bacterium]|nr:FkbM family methyltransferase [bacterium]
MFLSKESFYKVKNRLLKSRIDYFRRCCSNLAAVIPEAIFVKVGANDGISDDPCSDILLGDAKWKGLLIEPVPYCFKRLKENFSDTTRFLMEQAAIGPVSGKKHFYYVSREAVDHMPDLPFWYDKIGSFDRNHILKHLNNIIEPFIIEIEVEVFTLNEVLKRKKIRKLHLLHIDTEGYDYEILRTLDFARYKPAMIFIEHRHLRYIDKIAMRRLFRDNGYSVFDCGVDYFAFDKGIEGVNA